MPKFNLGENSIASYPEDLLAKTGQGLGPQQSPQPKAGRGIIVRPANQPDTVMNHIFTIKTGYRVPEGRVVHPLLNPQDPDSGLPFDLIEGFSIAAGEIAPHSQSMNARIRSARIRRTQMVRLYLVRYQFPADRALRPSPVRHSGTSRSFRRAA